MLGFEPILGLHTISGFQAIYFCNFSSHLDFRYVHAKRNRYKVLGTRHTSLRLQTWGYKLKTMSSNTSWLLILQTNWQRTYYKLQHPNSWSFWGHSTLPSSTQAPQIQALRLKSKYSILPTALQLMSQPRAPYYPFWALDVKYKSLSFKPHALRALQWLYRPGRIHSDRYPMRKTGEPTGVDILKE